VSVGYFELLNYFGLFFYEASFSVHLVFSDFLVTPSTDFGSRVGWGFHCTPCKIDVKLFLISRLLVGNFVNLFL
jgi:hypothetical protein